MAPSVSVPHLGLSCRNGRAWGIGKEMIESGPESRAGLGAPPLRPDASPAGEWLDMNSNYKRLSEGGMK